MVELWWSYGGVMVNSTLLTMVLLVTVVLSAARHGVAVPLRCLSPSAAQRNRSCARRSAGKNAANSQDIWPFIVDFPIKNGDFPIKNGDIWYIWVCLKMLCTPLYPMVLLIIIPMKNGYFIGNIPLFSDKPICGKL